MRKRWTEEEIRERFNNSYPKPIWDLTLHSYYDFLEKHKDCEAANKLHHLMMEQEVVYADRMIVFFDNEEIGEAWTRVVFELNDELNKFIKERNGSNE